MERKIDNEQLVARLKDGDEVVFKAIFEEYFPKMKYFANEYLQDMDDAEDIVQNVFATLWEKRGLLADDTGFFNLLLSMTKNQCVDFIRKKQHQQKYIQQSHDSLQEEFNLNLYSLEHFDVDQLVLSELQQNIQQAIDTLPDLHKETFLMSRQHGLKYAVIAEKLKISIKTVEKRISGALIHLRKRLNTYVSS